MPEVLRVESSRPMNATLLKALVLAVPVASAVAWSVRAFTQSRTLGSTLQLIGAACLSVVVLVHVAEALEVMSFMRWGAPDSPGHYVDLSSAIGGIALFPTGVWLRRAGRDS